MKRNFFWYLVLPGLLAAWQFYGYEGAWNVFRGCVAFFALVNVLTVSDKSLLKLASAPEYDDRPNHVAGLSSVLCTVVLLWLGQFLWAALMLAWLSCVMYRADKVRQLRAAERLKQAAEAQS